MYPHVLALSSSRSGNSGYLEMAAPLIQRFLGGSKPSIAFIPFASVEEDYQGYLSRVREGLPGIAPDIYLVEPGNATGAIEKAGVIMTGGGNTFKLLHNIYALGLLDLIRKKVTGGTPYIGWSAGSNIAGASICTTNDMPVIEPESFRALNLLPFQLNPHYINITVDGHNGESRDQRLTEFCLLNPGVPVIALPEGTALQLTDGVLRYIGETAGVLFENATMRREIVAGEDLTFLMGDSLEKTYNV